LSPVSAPYAGWTMSDPLHEPLLDPTLTAAAKTYGPLVATAVWVISPELLIALDEQFGEPVDSYVNGSQVWLRTDGPNAETIEYRLHPVGGYVKPKGVPTDQIFSKTALACAKGEEPPAAPAELWGGLEAFIAFDDEGPLSPLRLSEIGLANLSIAATVWGMVDHEGIALRWEKSVRATSIVDELLAQLTGPVSPITE
jgi:hypothetical protein